MFSCMKVRFNAACACENVRNMAVKLLNVWLSFLDCGIEGKVADRMYCRLKAS